MNRETMHEEGQRLAALAQVLKANSMPQETINMVLAARCGLPMQKIDGKSPCFAWVDADAECTESEAAKHEGLTDKEFLLLVRNKTRSLVERLSLGSGINVLAAVMNDIAIPYGYVTSTALRPLASVDGMTN